MPQVPRDPPGGVVEWLMALVLKTSVPKGTVGSNPTPSVEIVLQAITGFRTTTPSVPSWNFLHYA